MSTAGLLTIFDSLMKKRFSHIVRTAVVSFLMSGLLAHLVVPFTSHAQKTAFTQWLNQNVSSDSDDSERELRNAILKLPETATDFRILVEQASQIIESNKDDFNLNRPLPENSSDQVTSWLVGQWTKFQHQQTGSDALLPETPAPSQKWISSNNFSKSLFTNEIDRTVPECFESRKLYAFTNPAKSLQPLKSGISINAP